MRWSVRSSTSGRCLVWFVKGLHMVRHFLQERWTLTPTIALKGSNHIESASTLSWTQKYGFCLNALKSMLWSIFDLKLTMNRNREMGLINTILEANCQIISSIPLELRFSYTLWHESHLTSEERQLTNSEIIERVLEFPYLMYHLIKRN